jgi:hypothetical protein
MKKQSYFLFLITMLCLAFAGSNSLNAQISKEGVKIRLFTKNDKGKSSEIKDISSILGTGSRFESGLVCCTGVSEFDRIELSGNATITIMVRTGSASENGDIVFLNKEYSLDKKAVFKPFEGREYFGRFTVYIMKEDATLLQFEYEFMSCT